MYYLGSQTFVFQWNIFLQQRMSRCCSCNFRQLHSHLHLDNCSKQALKTHVVGYGKAYSTIVLQVGYQTSNRIDTYNGINLIQYRCHNHATFTAWLQLFTCLHHHYMLMILCIANLCNTGHYWRFLNVPALNALWFWRAISSWMLTTTHT